MLLRRRGAWTLLAVLGLAAGLYASRHHMRGAALVARSAGLGGWGGATASWLLSGVSEAEHTVPSRHGPLRARLYRPEGDVERCVLLLPGLHGLGLDEPRLVGFVRNLAGAGLAALALELPDLKQYRITPATTDQIEDAALWLAQQPDLAPDGRVGLMGISFAGGLGVAAAGRPRLAERVAFVATLGGHGDLPRVLRYLCTGDLPDGSRRTPHDYGVAVILLNTVDETVPRGQVESLRAAVLTFLEASHLDMFDKDRAREAFARAQALEASLPEPSATLMHYVNTRNVSELGPRLLPHLAAFGGDPSLSPERADPPRAAVYLLHGFDDRVIPSVESALLADRLRSRTAVRLLISRLVTHTEIGRRPGLREVWDLISFWAKMLDE